MFYLSSLFQDDNRAFLVDHQYCSLVNFSNDSKPDAQVKTLENNHLDIRVSSNTYGDDFPSKSDDIFPSSENLNLQAIVLEPASNSLQSPFMGWDTLSI